MNNKLLKQFTKEEVVKALRQMAPLKFLGPDSFGIVFYQKYWKTVGMKVSNAVPSILNGEGMLPSLNSSFIALITKNVLLILLLTLD